ncbi:mevalonate kinase [Palaemon carinicauda]|uniref:mevalonate kinase n=1 Tax=Palaemon carinicauda TaxID=392227 RepID=UPI0035B5D5FF
MSANGEHAKELPEVFKVSAPGKVILHGEHSVVYGKRAVALSVGLRTYLTITVGGDSISLDFPLIDIKESWSLDTFRNLRAKLGCQKDEGPKKLSEKQSQCIHAFLHIGEEATDPRKLALLSFFHMYMGILPEPLPLSISVSSDLPIGAGLGSSAAYAVCLAGALLQLSGSFDLRRLSSSPAEEYTASILKIVSQWAFASEEIVHGTPSGIDNSVCTYGGAVSFKSGDISPIHIPPLKVLLVNSGVPRSTKALVSGVRERKERLPEVMAPILDSLDVLANKGLAVLQSLTAALDDDKRNQAFQTLEELVDINQALLCALGVSHASLDRLVGIARSHGLHAKLTGAGGGGFGIVIVPPSVNESVIDGCCEELRSSGYEVWSTSIGAPGLSMHCG